MKPGAHQPAALPFNAAKLPGLSEELLASHHDNNYAGALSTFDHHPLLVQYGEPWRTLFFTGTPTGEVATEIEAAIRSASFSWRGLADYHSSPALLAARLQLGYGLLFDAPITICALASRILEASGVVCSLLEAKHRSSSTKQLLVLGRSYIIAREIRFDSR